jgi:hypothetical protein
LERSELFVIVAKKPAAGRFEETWHVYNNIPPIALQNKLNELAKQEFVIFSVIWQAEY